MGFSDSLVEIYRNRSNFKKWENEQRDTQARREALHQKRPPTKEELKKAKDLGKTVVDVIDIMDNHSESIAQNVETATAPLSIFATMGMLVLSGFGFIKGVIDPAHKKKRAVEEEQIWKNDKLHELADKINKSMGKEEYGKNSFWSYSFTDEKRIQKISDPKLKEEAMAVYKNYKNSISKYNKRIKYGGIGIGVSTVAAFMGSVIYATKLQVDSSKIARFQARKMLEDPKAFVNYTPEQIAEAKKVIENNPELRKKKRKEKLNTGFLKGIISVFGDRKEYKQARKNDTDESKKVSRALSPEETAQANIDKEVLHRTVRIINNEAEKYSQSMEVAANIILGGSPILGFLAGLGINKIDNLGKFSEKFIDKNIKNHASEETMKLYNDFKAVKPKQPGYHRKWLMFMNSFREDIGGRSGHKKGIEENIAKGAKQSRSMSKSIKGSIAATMSNATGKSRIIGLITLIPATFAGLMISLKLQKSSARAGRFTAKHELEKDPRNFIGYTNEDFEEVKDVKAQKPKKGSKLKHWVMFIPNVMKRYYAYQKFRKNEYKEEKLLQDELMKLEVTDEQLTNAKNLQRKLFNTFEKVDDNSQQYSESTEAVIEIAKPFIMIGGVAAVAAPFAIAVAQTSKGNGGKVLQKVVGRLSKASNFLKSKTFKKYLKGVENNIPHKVANFESKEKPMAAVLKDINLKEDAIIDIAEKGYKNLLEISASFRKMNDTEQIKMLESLRKTYHDTIGKLKKNNLNQTANAVFDDLIYRKCLTPETRADILDTLILNKTSLEKMPKERLSKALESINPSLSRFSKDFEPVLTEEKLTNYLAFKDVIASDATTIKKDFSYKFSDFLTKPDEIAAKAKSLGLDEIIPIKSEAAAGIKKFTNPKGVLQELKTKVSKMSDAEFEEMAESLNLYNFEKKAALELFPKVEKIIDNIPKEELNAIFNKFITEFNKNPDEMIKLLSSGKIASVFMTPGLKKALNAAKISVSAFALTMTVIISVWLAELKLKAGRLGVIKATQSLDDPAYYANIEVKNEPEKNTKIETSAPENSPSLLAQFSK